MALASRPQLLQASTSARCAPFKATRSVACRSVNGFGAERAAGAALLASALLAVSPPAFADLNVYEAEAGGEFGRGSAMQYGEADIQGKDFSAQVYRVCD